MPTECSAKRFDFGGVEGRAVDAVFDRGLVTSDAGGLLLGAPDRAIGLVARFADCFSDHRPPHTTTTLGNSGIFGDTDYNIVLDNRNGHRLAGRAGIRLVGDPSSAVNGLKIPGDSRHYGSEEHVATDKPSRLNFVHSGTAVQSVNDSKSTVIRVFCG